MIKQDDPIQSLPVDILGLLIDFFGQNEARHDVVDDKHIGAVEGFQSLFSIRGIGDSHDGIGMGMVHIFKGNDGMQDGFDGRVRGALIQKGLTLLGHHVGIT